MTIAPGQLASERKKFLSFWVIYFSQTLPNSNVFKKLSDAIWFFILKSPVFDINFRLIQQSKVTKLDLNIYCWMVFSTQLLKQKCPKTFLESSPLNLNNKVSLWFSFWSRSSFWGISLSLDQVRFFLGTGEEGCLLRFFSWLLRLFFSSPAFWTWKNHADFAVFWKIHFSTLFRAANQQCSEIFK